MRHTADGGVQYTANARDGQVFVAAGPEGFAAIGALAAAVGIEVEEG